MTWRERKFIRGHKAGEGEVMTSNPRAYGRGDPLAGLLGQEQDCGVS